MQLTTTSRIDNCRKVCWKQKIKKKRNAIDRKKEAGRLAVPPGARAQQNKEREPGCSTSYTASRRCFRFRTPASSRTFQKADMPFCTKSGKGPNLVNLLAEARDRAPSTVCTRRLAVSTAVRTRWCASNSDFANSLCRVLTRTILFRNIFI